MSPPPCPTRSRRARAATAGLALLVAVLLALATASPSSAGVVDRTSTRSATVTWVQEWPLPDGTTTSIGLLDAGTGADTATVRGYLDDFRCPEPGVVPDLDLGRCTYLGTRVLAGDAVDLVVDRDSARLSGMLTVASGDAFGGDPGPIVGTVPVDLRWVAAGPPTHTTASTSYRDGPAHFRTTTVTTSREAQVHGLVGGVQVQAGLRCVGTLVQSRTATSNR